MKSRIQDRAEAEKLRKQGYSLAEISAAIGASKGLLSGWLKDVKVSQKGLRRLDRRKKLGGFSATRNAEWAIACQEKRQQWRREGKNQAKKGNALHAIGCGIYWGEGTKTKNHLRICNSDAGLLKIFVRFLREFFEIAPEDLRVTIIGYTDLESKENIELFWKEQLGIPDSSFRKHQFDERKYPSRGNNPLKKRRLRYGTCHIEVSKSTRVLQHIYGALEEYADTKISEHGEHSAVVSTKSNGLKPSGIQKGSKRK